MQICMEVARRSVRGALNGNLAHVGCWGHQFQSWTLGFIIPNPVGSSLKLTATMNIFIIHQCSWHQTGDEHQKSALLECRKLGITPGFQD